MAHDEHLHLAELVHAIQPASRGAGGASLGAEAVAKGGHTHGQLRFGERPVDEESSERNFGGTGEIEIVALDAVHLRVFSSGLEATALEDVAADEVRRRDGLEAVFGRYALHRPIDKSELENGRGATQIIKFGAGHGGCCVKVDKPER